jgi:hypothetical protein
VHGFSATVEKLLPILGVVLAFASAHGPWYLGEHKGAPVCSYVASNRVEDGINNLRKVSEVWTGV